MNKSLYVKVTTQGDQLCKELMLEESLLKIWSVIQKFLSKSLLRSCLLVVKLNQKVRLRTIIIGLWERTLIGNRLSLIKMRASVSFEIIRLPKREQETCVTLASYSVLPQLQLSF